MTTQSGIFQCRLHIRKQQALRFYRRAKARSVILSYAVLTSPPKVSRRLGVTYRPFASHPNRISCSGSCSVIKSVSLRTSQCRGDHWSPAGRETRPLRTQTYITNVGAAISRPRAHIECAPTQTYVDECRGGFHIRPQDGKPTPVIAKPVRRLVVAIRNTPWRTDSHGPFGFAQGPRNDERLNDISENRTFKFRAFHRA